MLFFRRDRCAGELSDRGIRAAVTAGRFERVVPGAYMARGDWENLHSDERLLARVLAVDRMQRSSPPVFSHLSAAAIWKLPIYGISVRSLPRVETTSASERPGRSSPMVMRHLGDWEEDEVQEMAGMRVTSLTRTALDLGRTVRPETALGCADAALRKMFGARKNRDLDDISAWQEDQLSALAKMPGRRGVAAARTILSLADPRADSVAESVSRLQLVRLGVPHEIQVPVEGLNGEQYWLDFEFIGQQVFGEMDGRIKYTEPGLMAGRTLEQVLLDEKERENQIWGITRKRFVRWGWDSIGTARILGARLRGLGIGVPGAP